MRRNSEPGSVQPAGERMDPATCLHPLEKWKVILNMTYCVCGARRMQDKTWELPQVVSV